MRRFAFLSVLLIQGCSGVVTMDGIQDNDVSEIGIYAVDSTQRVIMADMDNGRFCAEPPPETQMESESSFRMLLEAAIDTTSDTGKIEAYRALSEKARQLYRRSHSVQLYRDASYYLCQAYVNGALSVSPDGRQNLLSQYEAQKNQRSDLLVGMESQLNELLGARESLVEQYAAENKGAPQTSQELEKLEGVIKKLQQQVADLKTENESLDLMMKFTEIMSDDVYLVAQMMLAQRAFRSLDGEISEFYDSELSREKGKNEALSAELESFRKDFKAITEQLSNIEAGVAANSEEIKALKSEKEVVESGE